MRFEAEHEFAASRARVADLLCDAEFHRTLDLPDLSRPEVLEGTTDGATRVLRLRYEYVGQLDPVARRIVGDGGIAWIQELRLDTVSFIGTLSFSAERGAGRLNGAGDGTIVAREDGVGCRRRIAGDLRVRVPVVGASAERRIVPGLIRRLDVEADAVTRALQDDA